MRNRSARTLACALVSGSPSPSPIARRRPATAVLISLPGSTADRASGWGPGGFAIVDGQPAIHQHGADTRGKLLRVGVGRMILDRGRIEHHHIGEVAGLQ